MDPLDDFSFSMPEDLEPSSPPRLFGIPALPQDFSLREIRMISKGCKFAPSDDTPGLLLTTPDHPRSSSWICTFITTISAAPSPAALSGLRLWRSTGLYECIRTIRPADDCFCFLLFLPTGRSCIMLHQTWELGREKEEPLVGAHDLLKTYLPCQLAVRIQVIPRRISAALFSLFLGYDFHCQGRVESFGETFETIWHTNR